MNVYTVLMYTVWSRLEFVCSLLTNKMFVGRTTMQVEQTPFTKTPKMNGERRGKKVTYKPCLVHFLIPLLHFTNVMKIEALS